MDIIELRRGPSNKSLIRLISTEDTFSVRFRNPISGNQAAKAQLKLPFVLGRNIHARSKACPSGLALFRVSPDGGASTLPGMDNPVTVIRNSAMNCIRSQTGKKNSQIVACYHTYRRHDEQGSRGEELIPSGKLFLEFHRLINHQIHHQIFDHFHLLIDRSITYWEGSFVVSVTQATGCNPIKLAKLLQQLTFNHQGKKYFLFDYVDPIFHHGRSLPTIPQDPIFAYQWHLRNDGLSNGITGVDIGAPEAWDETKGSDKVKIAVIDDAFDLSAQTFNPDLIISPLNVFNGTDDVSPAENAGEWHGTSVLGLISSAHDRFGGCGVAPACPVIPIKLEPLVDDDIEARAFDHAVTSGAAVINCSWGPYDNYSQQPWPVPRLTQLAIENAYRNHIAVVFAAGNGAEKMDTDGYAGNPCVIAVSASTDQDQRAYYSDYGERIWVCAPSSGGSSGIVTSDVAEGGYNLFGNQTTEFGGTSAAAPLVSGVIALMQSAFLDKNPNQERLSVEEVRAILRLSARKSISTGAQKFNEYWKRELIDPALQNPDDHSLAFGYGCIDAPASVHMASKWKRGLANKELLEELQETAPKIRREPKILQRRSMRRIKTSAITFDLPEHLVDDPLSVFHQHRNEGFSEDEKSRFNSGEHVWLGTQGMREACQKLDIDFHQYATIPRGNKASKEKFSYGEIVALSGDFYQCPDDLFFEKPSLISWVWEDNDTSDLRSYFNKEIDAIKKQMEGSDISYPDYNIQYLWNAKEYAELAKDNESHFGWHNMVKYCHCHAWAIDMAIRSGAADEDEQGPLWRRSLYINAFADHFLTDGFAAGHIRVPRKEIIAWAEKIELSDMTSGFLSKLLHDQDGHMHTNHTDGEDRPEKDGLHVINSLGIDWWTRCDGQLFIKTEKDSPRLRQPILAVKSSMLELFKAKQTKTHPSGIYQATKHVPFPHQDEILFSNKFDPTNKQKIKQWVKGIDWYNFGVNEKNVTALFKALPNLMGEFRAAIKKDLTNQSIDLAERLPKQYIDAYKNLDKK